MRRTRFAPSPTSWLHLGHAYAARKAFDFATEKGGDCLLRIEDTDHTRCKSKYTHGIYTDLDWLGFDWPLPVRRQSQHYSDYTQIVIELIKRHIAYPCRLTRSDIKSGQRPNHDAFDRDEVIDILVKSARSETPALPFNIRLALNKAVTSLNTETLFFEEAGDLHKGSYKVALLLKGKMDPVIARKDIGCAYMIAGPHDDALQGITHIIRGEDLFHETAFHVLMQSLMDWPRPLYCHHGLVLAETGQKLSKRNLDTALKSLKEAGQTPQDIWNMTYV